MNLFDVYFLKSNPTLTEPDPWIWYTADYERVATIEALDYEMAWVSTQSFGERNWESYSSTREIYIEKPRSSQNGDVFVDLNTDQAFMAIGNGFQKIVKIIGEDIIY